MSVRFPLATLNYLLKTSGAPSNVMGGLSANAKGLYSDIVRMYNTAIPVRGLFLYKGTPPTQAELDALNGTLYTSLATSFRYSDLLINFAPINAPTFVENKALFALPATTPIRAGEAAWFIFGVFNNTGTNDNHVFVCGTVGTANAELNLITTTIELNKLYRFPQFALEVPKTFAS